VHFLFLALELDLVSGSAKLKPLAYCFLLLLTHEGHFIKKQLFATLSQNQKNVARIMLQIVVAS